MKKLVAIIMALTMLISCIPMMAFADEAEPVHTHDREEKAELFIRDLNKFIREEMAQSDFLDFYVLLSENVDEWKPRVDDLVAALQSSDPAKIKEALLAFGDYTQYIRDYVDKFDDPELKAAAERVLAEFDELDKFLEAHGYDIDQYVPEKLDEFEEKINAAYVDFVALVNAEFLHEAYHFLKDKAFAIARECGADEALLAKLENQFDVVEDHLRKYAGMTPEEAYEALLEDVCAQLQVFYEECLADKVEELKKILEENGITKENLEKVAELIKEIYKVIEEYKDMFDEYKDMFADLTPDEIMEKLIEEAQALIEEYQDEIIEAAMELADQMLEKLENGDFDEYLAPLGLTGQELEDLVLDIVAFTVFEAQGGSFVEQQLQLLELEMELEEALAEKADLEDLVEELQGVIREYELKTEEDFLQIEQLKKDLAQALAGESEKDEIIKKFINGYKVTTKKPTLKSVKNKKKKKAVVKFKGLKGAEVVKYQISYKTGKKTKKKTYKKATTSAKKLKYTLKKLKKGKKYTVKVRAIYSFKYEGKTYKFNSKWSKAKKVKIKK